jgi:hypothetical protein
VAIVSCGDPGAINESARGEDPTPVVTLLPGRQVWSGRLRQRESFRASVLATAGTVARYAPRPDLLGRRPCSRQTFSCASKHRPQPLIAETTSDHNSKSTLSTPGLIMARAQLPGWVL